MTITLALLTALTISRILADLEDYLEMFLRWTLSFMTYDDNS